MDQCNLLKKLLNLIINLDQKRKKVRINALYEGRELTLNAFRSGIFAKKAT